MKSIYKVNLSSFYIFDRKSSIYSLRLFIKSFSSSIIKYNAFSSNPGYISRFSTPTETLLLLCDSDDEISECILLLNDLSKPFILPLFGDWGG